MKIVFAHDSRFVRTNDTNIYTTGSLNYNVWKRYLNVFSEIVVISRFTIVKDINKLDISSGPYVTFHEVPNISSIKGLIIDKKTAKEIIKRELLLADGLIARLPSNIGSLAVKVAKKLNKPYAIEIVGCPWDSLWNYGNLKGKIYAPIAKKNLERIAKKSSHTLYVTKRKLQEKYPSYGITTNCSNVEINNVEKSVLVNRIELLYKEGKIYKIGLIGSVDNNIKGIDVAIKMLYEIRKIRSDVELHILGGGNPNKWIVMSEKMGISSIVHFHGRLPSGDSVYKWLDLIDIYIQPSYQEGLPRALIEAMSRGCPSLGSTAGGIPELLEEKHLHKPGDYLTLKNQVLSFINDKNEMKKAINRNYIVAQDYYSDLLTKRRNEFWTNFANHIKMQKVKQHHLEKGE